MCCVGPNSAAGTHKLLNVLDKLPNREHAQSKLMLCRISYAETRSEAERVKGF